MPSIRVLAKELAVSVITTKRAYEELEKEGVIESVPGRGFYVCEQKNEEIGRLTASIAEKDKTIVELTEERETMKARIAELEVQVPSDEKNLPVADSKDLQEEDAKEVTVTDDKAVSVEDEKKTGKGKTSK